MNQSLTTPKAVAELGEKIYREQYQEQYERDHPGKFVAIDVITQKAYISATPEGVLEEAEKDSPHGLFHLIQVGYRGAFRVSHTVPGNEALDWVFR
jgi:hypothetical protein